MSSILVGITTSPRPGQSYLLDTIRSVKAAGLAVRPRFVIAPNFIDPSLDMAKLAAEIGAEGLILPPLVDDTIDRHVRSRADLRDFHEGDCVYSSEYAHRGIQVNTDRLYLKLCDLCEGERGQEWFVALQDDLIMCTRALDRIWNVGRYIFPRNARKTGAVTFYSPMRMAGVSPKCLFRYPPNSFYGELAVLWRAEACREFVAKDNHGEAHDLEIGRFFSTQEKRWAFMGHSPCLVQHTGVVSARGAVVEGMQRTTPNFRADYDAIARPKPWP